MGQGPDHAALIGHSEDLRIPPKSKGTLAKGLKPQSDGQSLHMMKITGAAEWRRD